MCWLLDRSHQEEASPLSFLLVLSRRPIPCHSSLEITQRSGPQAGGRSVYKLPCSTWEMLRSCLHLGSGGCSLVCRPSLLKPGESRRRGGQQSRSFPPHRTSCLVSAEAEEELMWVQFGCGGRVDQTPREEITRALLPTLSVQQLPL